MSKGLEEKWKMPSNEATPHSCGEPIHRHNKWAARRVTYPNGKVRYYSLWCYLGRKKRFPEGVRIKQLRPKKVR